ncbi:hypothetical protein [Paracraurococcus lichenis]|uniref:DUF2169 domain-containing protein n=1 Tax=Paracraurococcus lichenis TaxID=3064888 RepID=A0ABT9DSM6_9PROT|nr:hypothetical protein [Paracraurococcus sp. LOR1-02]MDO9706830.1 hypothetical protein [Paracraurococcus sp. LOR1-02]
MDGIVAGHFPFLAIGLGQDGLCLRAIRNLERGRTLLLHCRGIEVGRLVLPRAVTEGMSIEVPVTRLPCVPLPAELRLSTELDGPDLAAPWTIDTPQSALTLLGAPEVQVEDLRLEHGVLRGTGREARNGLLEPVLFARINGSAARMVTAEPPVGLPEGGCAFRFSLPIRPADLQDTGLSVELYLIGRDAPIASFGWTRAGAGEAERRLAELESRLRQLEEEALAQQQSLQATLRRQLDIQQERIDAFIAAAATLLLDRLAAAPGSEPEALRSLLATGAPAHAGQPVFDRTAPQLTVLPEDGLFGAGWHTEESYPSGSFRWMSLRGLLLNPAPERPLAAVTLQVCHLYNVEAPALSAMLDDAPAEAEVSADGYGGFTLRLRPAEGPRPVRLVRLESLTGGSPAEDGESTDRRVLSFAVSCVVFDYAG